VRLLFARVSVRVHLESIRTIPMLGTMSHFGVSTRSKGYFTGRVSVVLHRNAGLFVALGESSSVTVRLPGPCVEQEVKTVLV
jgi:hypothetical protein